MVLHLCLLHKQLPVMWTFVCHLTQSWNYWISKGLMRSINCWLLNAILLVSEHGHWLSVVLSTTFINWRLDIAIVIRLKFATQIAIKVEVWQPGVYFTPDQDLSVSSCFPFGEGGAKSCVNRAFIFFPFAPYLFKSPSENSIYSRKWVSPLNGIGHKS